MPLMSIEEFPTYWLGFKHFSLFPYKKLKLFFSFIQFQRFMGYKLCYDATKYQIIKFYACNYSQFR